ncbi:MAG: tol-pal system protein YbgF [Syntrophales bacterium]|nr:tol-pal system protein YbgF [Syntrophales bacterium]MCK9528747.1 tol-pal system protein YbgF [Syntrophales bacterium]MDX9922962.1 tol-pal system protein YbgF [Syntrophales bacterium]
MNNVLRTIVVLCLVLLVVGCATQDDLRHVSRSADTKIKAVQDNLVAMERSAQDEIARMRKTQADLSADLITLRDEIQILRGAQETLQAHAQSGSLGGGDLQRALEHMEVRLQALESRLDISVPEVAPEITAVDRPRDSEALYARAYGLFKDGKYKESREGFREFLELFPDTEYSGNARFWIGESYYFEGKYEEAILEYQKVIQDYPQGSRISHALLKQALSFDKLGETASAKLLLQRVVRDFPGTTSAESARAKLLEIK